MLSHVVIRISNAKDVEFIFPKLPQDQGAAKKRLRTVFDKKVKWFRISNDEEFEVSGLLRFEKPGFSLSSYRY